MNLYWCETADHDEDWFVVASSARQACKLHEEAQGYGPGEAQAPLVCRIPRTLPAHKGWPDHALLRARGAGFRSDRPPRVVDLNATVYQQGGRDAVINRLADDYAEAAGRERLNNPTRLQ